MLLGDKSLIFLDKNGNFLSKQNYIYPLTDIDYVKEKKLLVAAGSVKVSSNVIFVTENFDININNQDYTYYLRTSIYPKGISISKDSGEIFFAGSNGKVYSCFKQNNEACSSIILESRFSINSYSITEDGNHIIGYTNGKADIYSADYKLIKTYNIGEKEVKILNNNNSNGKFAILSCDGYLMFLQNDSVKESKIKTYTLPLNAAISINDVVAVLKKDMPIEFISEKYVSRIILLNIFNIPIIILLILSILFFIYSSINLSNNLGGKTNTYLKLLFKDILRFKKCYIMLVPAFVFLGVFVFYPIIQGFLIAFQNYVPGVKAEWVGFDNFTSVFNNQYFMTSIKNMVLFLITDLLKALIPPMIIAELILAIKNKKAQYASRLLMYIPGILPGLAGLLIWKTGILGAEGVISQLFSGLGFNSLSQINWLGNDKTAIWSLIFIGFPYVGGYIIIYGALMGVANEYYEAAKIDGCSWIKRITLVDIPMIRPQLKYIFVLSFIGSIQDFQRVYMTTGGSYNTYIPSLELFYNINTFNNYGAAAAMGLLLFLLIFSATLFNLKLKSAD